MAEKYPKNEHYKIVYFPAYGRAEVLRYILAYGGVKPEEEVIQASEWFAKRKSGMVMYGVDIWATQVPS